MTMADYLKNRFNARKDRRQVFRMGDKNKKNILNNSLADTEYVLSGKEKIKLQG